MRFDTGGLQPSGCFIAHDPDGRVAVGVDTCGELSPTGGTLALSGTWLRDDGATPAGPPRIVGAGVMTNGGLAAARWLARAGCFEQLATHELGHTLGVAHSESVGPMAAFIKCDFGFGTTVPTLTAPLTSASRPTQKTGASVAPSLTVEQIGAGSGPSLSGDGRYVAFDRDGFINVYDRSTRATSREGAGRGATLSRDGRFVVFNSFAANPTQVYVRDRALGSTVLASASNPGAQGNADSIVVSISGDGRFVSFISAATNLVPGDTSGIRGVFTRDLQLGVTTRDSVDADGRAVDLDPGEPLPAALSSDGRFVAFATPPLSGRVLVRDRTTGQVTIESIPDQGFLSSGYPSISDDGRWILFRIVTRVLAPGAAVTAVRDRQTGAVAFLPDNASVGKVSGDGRFVSYVGNRFPGAVAGVWDRVTGQITTTGTATGADISRVAGDAVSYALDGVVYVAAAARTPNAPTILTVSVSGSTVMLAWTAPTEGAATSYVIEAGSTPGASNLANFTTNSAATTFTATGVGAGTYFVRVRASNAGGVSAPSNEIMVIVASTCVAPAVPTNLVAVVSGSTVSLNWSPAAGATTYLLDVGSTPGASDVVMSDLGSSATSLSATGVGAGTYFVRVRGGNSCGTSGPSNETVVVVR